MKNPSEKVVSAAQKLQEGVSSLVEKGQKAFEGVIDQFTPTDSPDDAREVAYRARMREIEDIRAAENQGQSQQKAEKK